ncbi:MAG: cob(I)yrinic acid a,c-diamide adenosyltransferase [Gemmatimonadota bacterium]|nr:cob(I)yrinic acid a,c-diamide adenosyltransferase [Gemmatimonadota bacterium]MDE2872880.1 cob(I)yrinic acid a,c-diamide adenosyltransferase [Gemmatimonadota bacterium]
MKIYTRRGDSGETGLFGGGRTRKDDPRVEAYGTVDELNAAIGAATVHLTDAGIRARLGLLQSDLFAIGAHLATPPPRKGRPVPSLPELPAERVAEMESWIDEAVAAAPPLRSFILPAGGAGASGLHLARAVCRRAERRVVALSAAAHVDPVIIRHLNRLSDYLFAAARVENLAAGRGDIEWRGSG